MCSEVEHPDYESRWAEFAQPEEECRFLSSSREDLSKICEVVDLNRPDRERTGGGIPVHYDQENNLLYTLKPGHCLDSGSSGFKKSRTSVCGQIVSCGVNKQSMIIGDPKGELYTNKKIQGLLQDMLYNVIVLDMRHMDKDGFNVLSYALRKYAQNDKTKAENSITQFVGGLKENRKGADDPYWNDMGGTLLFSVIWFLMELLTRMGIAEEAFHLGTVKAFVRQQRDVVNYALTTLLKEQGACLENSGAVREILEILALPDRTYACVISSAVALLSSFCATDDLLHMLSFSTFDIRSFYRRPSALFLVIPDETKAYDEVTGYMIDTFYQTLVDEYESCYQNGAPPACRIHFICDEAASIRIPDMASKISASRSREIEWTLIYQSDKQMEKAYPDDFGTILGNSLNTVFLGSTDYDILRSFSERVGNVIGPDGRETPLVSVADLRRMRKEWTYKEALVISGPYLYCARLPDYDQYPFLNRKTPPRPIPRTIRRKKLRTYSPEQLLLDLRDGTIKKALSRRAASAITGNLRWEDTI